MKNSEILIDSRIQRLLFLYACAATVIYVFSHAWVAEDAYITFHVVDNFVNGYGLRWNIDERVQVYTHPLWMLLHIPLYAVFSNIFWVTVCLSACIGAAAIYWIFKSARISYPQFACIVLLPIILSRAFKDHIISGLETPLTCFLLGWFYYVLAKNNPNRLYRLIFIASLCLLSRFDNVFLIAPALVWAMCRYPGIMPVSRILLAATPFIVWAIFSVLYYGFLFPNTKYAKLNTGIPTADYVTQGLYYLRDFIFSDTVGFICIVLAMGCAVVCVVRRISGNPVQNAVLFLPAAGIFLHIAYVIYIGGDFMSGRFFVPSLFLALWILAHFPYPAKELYVNATALVLLMAVTQYFIIDVWKPPSKDVYANNGIVNERLFYLNTNTAIRYGTHEWFFAGHKQAQIAARSAKPEDKTIVNGLIGMYGYAAGSGIKIIDKFALTDPLLARLPISPHRNWRIGHFVRDVPEGYYLARSVNDLSAMPEPLRRYYEKLRLVTSSDLWDPERLRTIKGFMLGEYDHWLQDYLNTLKKP